MFKNQLFIPNAVITVVINILLCLFLHEKHYSKLVVLKDIPHEFVTSSKYFEYYTCTLQMGSNDRHIDN